PYVQRAGLAPAIDVLVLDDVAGDRTDASLTGARIKWSGTATTRRILVVDAHDLLPYCWRSVVHQSDILGNLESRPRPPGCERLADRIVTTGARVAYRLQCIGAHRFQRCVNDLRRVLGSDVLRQDRRNNNSHQDKLCFHLTPKVSDQC